ncbi:MAG: DUF2267 domain-containing protein [Nitrospirota bacterium]
MKYDAFVSRVQNSARLGSTDEAVKAIGATLEVLGERLVRGEAEDLAAQLPSEIGRYLLETQQTRRFDLKEFFNRVSEREGVDLPTATHHARVVLSVLTEAVSPGEIKDILSELPAEFHDLFKPAVEEALSERHS